MAKYTIYLVAALAAGLLVLAACAAPLPPAMQPGSNVPPAAPRDAAPLDEPTPDLFVPTPEAALDESQLPPAALAAQQTLANQLQVDPQSVSVLSVEAVDWPSACLGAEQPGEMCAAVITPGYRIILTANGSEYVVHTNDDGSNYRIVDSPAAQVGDTVISWVGSDAEGACVTAEIALEGVAYGGCNDEKLVPVPLVFSGRPDDLDTLRLNFAPFAAATAAGDVVFMGVGNEIATEAEQRMIAERARAAFFEARGGASAVGSGLALQSYQEGGIAALCQSVSLYLTGIAYVADCTTEPAQTLPVVLLDSDQLAQLYAWYDTLAPFESTRSDGTADVMTTTMSFFGVGSDEASAETQQAMDALAQEVAAAARSKRSADVCPAPTLTLALYRNDLHGYCLLFPETVAPVEVSPTSTVFAGDGDIMNHTDGRLEIEVIDGGGDAAAAADALEAEVLASIANAQLERSDVTLGAMAATQVDKVPGQDFSRVVFVGSGDTLLKLTFVPADPEMNGYEGMQMIYDVVISSFTFMEQVTQ